MTTSDFYGIEFFPHANPTGTYVVGRKITINWDFIWSIPEFSELKKTRQSPKWHSEGEFVSDHVIKVVEKAVDEIEHYHIEYTNDRDVDILLMSAIFHDIGKCRTTFFKESDQLWHHYGHEIEGEKITRRILWDLPIQLREEICSLVRWHMEPLTIMRSKDFHIRILDLSYKVPNIKLLSLLKMFDLEGSVPENISLVGNEDYIMSKFVSTAISMNCYDEQNPVLKTINDVRHKLSNKPKISVDLYMGLPGAGKDTTIKGDPDIDNKVVVCRDDIRVELGMCEEGGKVIGTDEEEKVVTKIFNERMVKAAKEGKHIILNNMNNKRKYRDGYKALLSGYDVTWRYIMCEARGLEKNIERRNGQIPASIFPTLVERMEWPTPDEYDSIEFVLS